MLTLAFSSRCPGARAETHRDTWFFRRLACKNGTNWFIKKRDIFKLGEPQLTKNCCLFCCEKHPNYMFECNDRSSDGTMVSCQLDVHETSTFHQIQIGFTCFLAEMVAEWERREQQYCWSRLAPICQINSVVLVIFDHLLCAVVFITSPKLILYFLIYLTATVPSYSADSDQQYKIKSMNDVISTVGTFPALSVIFFFVILFSK